MSSINEKKRFLKQAYRLNERIKDKEDRIADLRMSSTSVGSFDYSKDKVQSSSKGDAPFANQVMQIIELEDKLKADIEELTRIKIALNHAIDKVDNINCALLLSKRYIFMWQWEDIADDMNYSLMQIHRIHKKALELFEIPKDFEDSKGF